MSGIVEPPRGNHPEPRPTPDTRHPRPDTRLSAMRYRTFPGTSISVSEVGFGTWTLATGWWGEKTDAEAVAMLRRAHDVMVHATAHQVLVCVARDGFGKRPLPPEVVRALEPFTMPSDEARRAVDIRERGRTLFRGNLAARDALREV